MLAEAKSAILVGFGYSETYFFVRCFRGVGTVSIECGRLVLLHGIVALERSWVFALQKKKNGVLFLGVVFCYNCFPRI